MPTTVAIKELADGQLPNSKGTLYTTPASTQAIVQSIILVNTGSGANLVNLYKKASGGTSRRLITKDTSVAAGNALVVSVRPTLEAGGLIEGDATNATEVDFTINGVENS